MHLSRPIGFSTGCFYRTSLSLIEVAELASSVGATAIEIGFNANDFETLFTDPAVARALAPFQYISLHAPTVPRVAFWGRVVPRCLELQSILPRLDAITVHPDFLPVSDLLVLPLSDVPWALENMDKKKKVAQFPDFFRDLTAQDKEQLRFVIDVQHIFEHDPTMALAESMRDAMEGRIAHLHVSGEIPTFNHEATHRASNAAEVVSAVRLLPYPIILEGALIGTGQELLDDAMAELNFWEHHLA